MSKISIFDTDCCIDVLQQNTVSAIGFAFGRKLGERFGKRAEIGGGFVLVAIGISVIV